MKKTSLYLDPQVDRALSRRAAERGISKAEYIRSVLGKAAQPPKTQTPRGRGSFSGPPDLAENLDDHLAGFGEP